MSPKECECSVYPKSTRDDAYSPVLDREQSPVHHHTRMVACLTLGNSRDSLSHPSQIQRNANFSTGSPSKHHGRHIISRREQIPRILLKSQANFPQAPQGEFFLKNMYVRGNLCFLLQVKWTPSCPDAKEAWITLQRLNEGSSFISQMKGFLNRCRGNTESPSLPLISTGGLTSF